MDEEPGSERQRLSNLPKATVVEKYRTEISIWVFKNSSQIPVAISCHSTRLPSWTSEVAVSEWLFPFSVFLKKKWSTLFSKQRIPSLPMNIRDRTTHLNWKPDLMTFSSFRHLQTAHVLEKLATEKCGESIFNHWRESQQRKMGFLRCYGATGNNSIAAF